MERNIRTVRIAGNRAAGNRLGSGRPQRKAALRALLQQSFGLCRHFLRTILSDHAHPGVDRGHDFADVTRLRGCQQFHRTDFATGLGFGGGDTVQHTMHAVRNLLCARRIDHLIGKVFVVHISSHLIAP